MKGSESLSFPLISFPFSLPSFTSLISMTLTSYSLFFIPQKVIIIFTYILTIFLSSFFPASSQGLNSYSHFLYSLSTMGTYREVVLDSFQRKLKVMKRKQLTLVVEEETRSNCLSKEVKVIFL